MKSSKYISILCVGSLLSLASCTDGFESDNKINGSFDDTVKEYDFQKYTTNFETIQRKHSASCVFFSPLFLPTFVASL